MSITDLCYPDKSITITCSEDFAELLGQIREARRKFYEIRIIKPDLILTTYEEANRYEMAMAEIRGARGLPRPIAWHQAPMFDDIAIVGLHRATAPGQMAMVFWGDLPNTIHPVILAKMYPGWEDLSPEEMSRATGGDLRDVVDYLAKLEQAGPSSSPGRRR